MPRKSPASPPAPIGQQIAAARKAAGLTQVVVAEAAGLSQGRLSSIERGEYGSERLSVPVLCRIAEALGMSLLIDGRGARLIDPAIIRIR